MQGGITKTEDVVHLSNHVAMEKVIVMDHLTEDPMMVMMVVLVTWCVGLTTVSSLEHIIIPR